MITIKVDDREVTNLLKNLSGRIRNLKPLMSEIGDIALTSIDKNFQTGGRFSTAGSWKGGSRKWKPSLRVKKQGGQTLVDSGSLASSISKHVTGSSVMIGTNKKYGAIHQFGGEITAKGGKYLKFKTGGRWAQKKSVNIPARPFLVLQDEDMAEIKKAAANYLLKGVN